MREIKFRAWDTETKEMSYDFLSKNWLKVCIESPYVELMQYTGLKDVKGIEMYEGDVIETEQINWADSGEYGGMKTVRGRVVWSGSGFRLLLESGAMPELNFGSNYHVVKGNIYEHPHLLYKEDNQ